MHDRLYSVTLAEVGRFQVIPFTPPRKAQRKGRTGQWWGGGTSETGRCWGGGGGGIRIDGVAGWDGVRGVWCAIWGPAP